MTWTTTAMRVGASVGRTLIATCVPRLLKKDGVVLGVIYTSDSQAKEIVTLLNNPIVVAPPPVLRSDDDIPF